MPPPYVPPYVTITLHSGLGNRFFQVAAMLGYAERYGHTPVFVPGFIKDTSSHPGPHGITDFFPDISILVLETEWTVLNEEGSPMAYTPLPRHNGNVRLHGMFQSHLYFPTSSIPIPHLLLPKTPNPTAYFLHVRRGDFLHPLCTHHNVPLGNYWKRCVSMIPDTSSIVVCSEDMAWCKATLPAALPSVKPHQWIFTEATTDTETLSEMIGCWGGGICANSTFSWWAAYWNPNVEKRVFMPGTWGFPPMPVARDIWPPWCFKVPTAA